MANEVKNIPNIHVGYLKKNVSGQWVFFWVYTDAGVPQTEQTANISHFVSKDGGNPLAAGQSIAEVGSGLYKFQLAASETNADLVVVSFTHSGTSYIAPQFFYTLPDYYTDITGSGFASITDSLDALRTRMENAMVPIVRDD